MPRVFCGLLLLAVAAPWFQCDKVKAPSIDKVGGSRLVYELTDAESEKGIEVGEAEAAMQQALNPTGTEGITVKIDGSKLEVSVPKSELNDLETVKRRVTSRDELALMIVANEDDAELKAVIEKPANEGNGAEPKDDTDVLVEGKRIAKWFPVKTLVNGALAIQIPPEEISREVEDKKLVLLKVSKDDVTSKDLENLSVADDEAGRPSVRFELNAAGSKRMSALTRKNFQRRLAIVLGGKIVTAPMIHSEIADRGMISGNFTREEANDIASMLMITKFPFTVANKPPQVIPVAAP